MKICPECGRNYGDDAVVCAYDGFGLTTGSTTDWGGDAGAEPEPGDVLGAYRILDLIAEGGMGMVYRCEHVRLGRKVALKVLKPNLAKRTDIVRRFFEEARAVNEIGHPNIVDIIDFVEVSDQDPPLVFMVMELLPGEDLAKRVRSAGPLDPDEVVTIASQVCDALIAVHRVRILHRDLKPENIFLEQQDEGVKVKLLDFGVAKAFGERQKLNMTDPGTCVGTPEYMAPEQILSKELDERTDIYSLGLVLYDMLTNTVPFQATKYGELMIAQVKELPEPLSSRRKEGAPVPEALEQTIMRCLEKKPQDRFQNVKEFKHALLAAMGQTEPLMVAPGPTASVEAPLELPRRKLPLFPIILGLVALLGGFGAVWLLKGKKGQPGVPNATVKAAAEVTRPDARIADPDAAVAATPTDGATTDVEPGPRQASRKTTRRPARRRGKLTKTKTKKRGGGIEATLDPFSK